jgi:hypothetical protein
MSGWEHDLFPALEVWRRYRARNPDRIDVHDPLWRAACWDMTAQEHLAAGQVNSAMAAWRQARAIEDEEFEHLGITPWTLDVARPGRREAA